MTNRSGSKETNGAFLNHYIMKWVVSGIVLVLAIFIMLVNYSVSGKQGERKSFNRKLISQAEVNADRLSDVIKISRTSSSTMARYMRVSTLEDIDYSSVLKAIMNETGAYNVVICSQDGTVILPHGNSARIDQTDYFDRMVLGEELITSTLDDGIYNRKGIVIVMPITLAKNAKQYIISYFNPDEFTTIVRRRDFGDSSFCLLLDETGRVIVSENCGSSKFLTNTDNFFEVLKQDEAMAKRVEWLQISAQNGEISNDYFTIGDEKREIIISSIEGSQFLFVVGIDDEYINKEIEALWSQNAGLVRQILVFVIIFICVVVVINIVIKTKQNENSKKLADIADTDLLTDLYNKAATEREIIKYLAEHPDDKGLLLVLDIDNFKKINDTMGHAFGDEVLRTFGVRIRSQVRVTDIVGRAGGDEFIIFLHDMSDMESILNQAKRIEQFFHNFQAGEYVKYSATASIGAAIYPDHANDFDGLFRAADHALYVAKKRGKNQLAIYGDDSI